MKLKVAISGLIYPVTMMRYFWDALEAREDVEVFSTGPFFGNWIPWNNGMTIANRYIKTPTVPLFSGASHTPFSHRIISDVTPKDIDLWLQVDAGWHFSDRPDAKKVALIETDPHVLKDHYRPAKAYSDYTFCMQTPYIEADEIYLPYACDVRKFYPEERPIRYECCLIGLHYPQRDELVNRLANYNVNVYYSLGDVFDEYRNIYNESKIALSWSSLQDLPVRVFEAMGMKRPLVCNHVPDMDKFFVDGTHYIGFTDALDASTKILDLLDKPERLKELAEAGYNEVIAKHTWDQRIQFILEQTGVL